MGSWIELSNELDALVNATPEPDRDRVAGEWFQEQFRAALTNLRRLRDDRNVILYFSGFLQKGGLPELSITHEDLNGFMSTIYGMDCTRGLTLVLHTPGGVTTAAETIVDYLRSKFSDLEVVVPALCMSAGTMIALSSDRILMGRQSQLGPIDPQMPMPSTQRYVSARAIREQFEVAREAIQNDRDSSLAWAPILQSMGPALLQEATNAIDYSEALVARWLERYMFAGRSDAAAQAQKTALHFSQGELNRDHGRRIDRDEARAQQVVVLDLETDQELQEAVLQLYHVTTLAVQRSPLVRLIMNDAGATWVKNYTPPESL